MIVHKIRRKTDGLFSTGGAFPSFNNRGKIWRQRGHLTNHLNQVGRRNIYENCEIVSFELVETEVDTKPVKEYLDERAAKKEQERQEQLARREAGLREERFKQYIQLQQEFGNKQ